MQVLLTVSVSLFVFSWARLSQATPLQSFDRLPTNKPVLAEPNATDGKIITSVGEGNGESREIFDDVDFEDDDSEESAYLVGLAESSVNSVTHLHQKNGEILVPCFGMWWPVGGTPAYDYVGDYYGDYRKKRRRARKQKKAARMQKKKS